MKTMLSRVLAVAVVVGAVAVPQVAEAADGPVQMPGTTHWYEYVSTPERWADAQARASIRVWHGMVGHLATVASGPENDFITTLAPSSSQWLGGRDVAPAQGRRFEWVSGPDRGSRFTYCSAKSDAGSCVNEGFAAWGSFGGAEPNNSRGSDSELCLEHVGWSAGQWNDNACWGRMGYVVEYEPQQQAAEPDGRALVPMADFTTSGTFTAPKDGWYRFEMVGGGGSGGNQGAGWAVGGGGGGGAYAAGSVLLAAGEEVTVTVGSGGKGPRTSWTDGRPGSDSSAGVSGKWRLTAGGGAGGLGRSGNSGGRGGQWSSTGSVSAVSGFPGGDGGDALIVPTFNRGYHQGGEGGSAANSTGPGNAGTSERCVWAAAAVTGNLPTGAGGIGSWTGYDGACGLPLDWDLASFFVSGGTFGGGGGGDKEGNQAGDGGDGIVRISRITTPPSAPTGIVVAAADSSATISWRRSDLEGSSPITAYTVTASPGGSTCVTQLLSCIVSGLVNRKSYTFTVTATNADGTSDPSAPSSVVMPLTPGFQTWADDSVLALGSSTTLKFAQAAAAASIAVTGSAKAAVTTDSAGFGSATFTASKVGIQKFTATYSVKVGKKTTKYSATTQLYVPSVMGPMLKIKQGKTGKFSLQFMPPGAAVVIALTDGRAINLTADSAGKASTTTAFNTRGAVNYTVTVSGVQVAIGGLTIS